MKSSTAKPAQAKSVGNISHAPARSGTKTKARRSRTGKAALADFAAAIPSIPASELRTLLDYSEPLTYKPHTTDLAALRMDLDDVQVLRYLFRNARPQRHLEFGTWEGRSALACLEECEASVWTINLRAGEQTQTGATVYGRVYGEGEQGNLSGHYHVVGTDDVKGGIVRSYRTDGYDFIGHVVHAAGYGHRLCQIYADSRAWDASAYPADFFDSVLIDGGHERDTVINDTRKALARLRPGGLVIWHDFCPDPDVFGRDGSSTKGVVSALQEIWDEVEPQLTAWRWVEGTWLLVGLRAAEAGPGAVAGSRKVRAGTRKGEAAQAASGLSSLKRELDALASFHEERAALADELMRARSEKAALEQRVANYAALVHERDMLVARNAALLEKRGNQEAIETERDALKRETAELRARFADLNAQLQRADADRQRAAEQAAAAETRSSEQRQELAGVAAERDRLRSDLSARDDRIARIEAEATERADALDALRRQHTELSATLAERDRRLAALEAEAARLTEALDARTAELDAQRQTMLGHNQQNAALEAEMTALREARDALQADQASLREAYDALEARNSALAGQCEALEADLGQARGEADLRAREAAALEGRIAGLNEKVASLQDIHAQRDAAAQDRIAALNETAQHLRASHAQREATLQDRIDALDETVARLGQERDGLRQDLAARERELSGRIAEVERREQRVAEMAREISALEKAVTQAGAEKGALSGELDTARQAIGELQRVRDELETEVSQQRNSLAALTAQLEARSAELEESGARLDRLEAERQRLAVRLEQSEDAQRLALSENVRLSADLDARSLEVARLDADLQERSAEIARLSAAHESVLGDIEKQRRSLGQFDHVLAQFRRENEDLRAAIDDYTSSHSWRITAPLRAMSRLLRR